MNSIGLKYSTVSACEYPVVYNKEENVCVE